MKSFIDFLKEFTKFFEKSKFGYICTALDDPKAPGSARYKLRLQLEIFRIIQQQRPTDSICRHASLDQPNCPWKGYASHHELRKAFRVGLLKLILKVAQSAYHFDSYANRHDHYFGESPISFNSWLFEQVSDFVPQFEEPK